MRIKRPQSALKPGSVDPEMSLLTMRPSDVSSFVCCKAVELFLSVVPS